MPEKSPHNHPRQDTPLHQLPQSRDAPIAPRAPAPPTVFADAALPQIHPNGPPAHPSPGAVRSLYIHVPFCFHKCHYCDFYSIVDTRDRQAEFVARLCDELAALAPWARGVPLRTVFVGGGTPSLLAVPLWEQLLKALARAFDLSDIRAGRGEFTVECNPETVTPDLMAALRAGGVDRVSVGAQSFNPAHLKTLERWHDPDNVARAITMARAAGINRQSLDLIFGIPGQSLADWQADLDRALALGAEHLSCYNLTYEPGTAMNARLARGDFTPADEDLEVEMFRVTRDRLHAAGLARYEISNFARPNAQSLHNCAYWRQDQWLAAGPSASAHVAHARWKNTPRLDDYLHSSRHGFAPITDHEPAETHNGQPTPHGGHRGLRERLMTGIRLSAGLDWDDALARARSLNDRHGTNPADRLESTLRRLTDNGWVDIASPDVTPTAPHSTTPPGRQLRLTDAGLLMANRVAAALMDAVGNS